MSSSSTKEARVASPESLSSNVASDAEEPPLPYTGDESEPISSTDVTETTSLLTVSRSSQGKPWKGKKGVKVVSVKVPGTPKSPGPIATAQATSGRDTPTSPLRKPFVPDRQSHMYHRLNLYRKLSGMAGKKLENIGTPPNHILPSELFGWKISHQKQGSLSTIFSIWNTMIGSSMLMVPWGYGQSGLYPALALTMVIGLYCYYTSRLIVIHGKKYKEFADVCETYIGRWSWYLALIASIIVMTGAIISYDTLLTDSLYSLVVSILVWAGVSESSIHPNVHETGWQPLWAAICVFLIVFPLSNIRKTIFIVKIASSGLIFVFIVMAFVLSRSIKYMTPETITTAEGADMNFGRLSGMLAVSFFIHNAILPIMSNAKNPEKNLRDHAIGFGLVIATYFIMGIVPFLAGQIVMQNFMNIYVDPQDVWAFVARAALFLQLTSILPLLVSIVRTHILGIFATQDSTTKWYSVMLVNFFVVGTATTITIFFPNSPGSVLGYVGSIIGSIYVCALPIAVHLRSLKKEKKLKRISLVLHILLLIFGVFLFTNQYYLKSSVCLHNCTDHGVCNGGVCACTNATFVGDDCSIVVVN
uniref:Amino acid transporter transmembrane domain-containing protein n=1 Tax=Palpitomonas bilix TaxID=652834 RepID=A0A7S3GLR2_9EUKA|mmetsp:Transcript_8652/g.23270  ORF Transcript_8652/g.23270 Transcript_8652/m.23270 type:complete len:587 (+) Transcript_8652:111-1871(+)